MRTNVIPLPIVQVVNRRPVRMVEAPLEFKDAILQKTELTMNDGLKSPLNLIESVIFVNDDSILAENKKNQFGEVVFWGNSINFYHRMIFDIIRNENVPESLKVDKFSMSDGREFGVLILPFASPIDLILMKFVGV